MSNIVGDVNNVKNTFSSWDSCMAKSYCKWPVIAGIIIGSLIILSVLWCIGSCLCCGATLCGSCVRCLTCFGCCGACGDRGRGGRTRHKDDYTQMPPTPYNGYQAQPSPMVYQPPAATPQYAQFDTAKKIHEDSLPAMPTWGAARERRVENYSEPVQPHGNDMEMGRMGMSTAQAPSRVRGGYNQIPNGPVSPMSPPTEYGHFEGQAQPYSSDIGTQRLGQQQTGYSDFNPSPLSPAPTYRTYATPEGAMSNSNRFVPGASSPGPQHFNHQTQFNGAQERAWSPPSQHHETPIYSSYNQRSLSPPADYHSSSHSFSLPEQSDNRPPSLLQIGRKPVLGSQREV